MTPRLFNIMVDTVVREWLCRLLGDKAVADGYGPEVERFVPLFYTNNRILVD